MWNVGFYLLLAAGYAAASRSWTMEGASFSGELSLGSEPVGLCGSTKQKAGYFKIDGTKSKNYFYWYFESRHEPATDPVILWMTGGPGCSSAVAQFHENGPCKINADHATTSLNPYSWNSNASIIYIDQPAGVGFSYDNGIFDPTDRNEAMVSTDMYHFLHEFSESNGDILTKNKFFIFGESYGGHFAPAVAARVADSLNLKGLSVGNGLTDPITQYEFYAEMAHNESIKLTKRPAVTLQVYQKMVSAIPACIQSISQCASSNSEFACMAAQQTCNSAEMTPYYSTGLNPYDIRVPCGSNPLCYDFSDVKDFLDTASVKQALDVPSHIKWESCNYKVNGHFAAEWVKSFEDKIPILLAKKVDVLIYAGDMDFVCNWLGNKAWTMRMPWPGHDAYNKAADLDWTVSGEKAGVARTAEGLTFLRVFDAGHMVPLDQPERALSMLNTFLAGESFHA